MKSVIWNNGQRIIKQLLDWFNTSGNQNTQERLTDYTQAGILVGYLNEMDIIAGTNNTPSTPSITVRTGSAYDSNGERLVIADETLSYDATNPTDTTSDGVGGFVLTPHSTGSKNIPLTVNSFNYIWMDYLATTDESVFTLQTATNAKQFYKQTNGYKITVTTTNVAPSVTSVYLGSVNLTGSGVVSVSTISKNGRTSSLITEHRVKIKTPLADLSDVTATYGYNQEATLDDHIKAIGSGTISPSNPHGMALIDIGVDVETVVSNHQKFMHNSGIIGSRTTLVSSLYAELHSVTPGDDFIVIKALTTNEVVNVNGLTITSSDIPSDVTFLFSSSGDLSGTYYIYLDKSTKSLIRTTIDPSSDPTKFPLWSMTWTQGVAALFDGNITALTDKRIFGTINSSKIDNKDSYDMYRVRLEDGTVSLPSLTWQSDTTTGIYRSGSGILSFTSNGVLSANISGGQITAVNGSAAAPSYSFLNDPNTGIYALGSDNLRFATGGVGYIEINNTGNLNPLIDNTVTLGVSGQGWKTLYTASGSASTPAVSFSNDTDSGLYRTGANAIALGVNGTQALTIGTTGVTTYVAGTIGFDVASTGTTAYVGGVETMDVRSAGIRVIDGTLSLPSYSFISDTSTGFRRQTSGVVDYVSSGVRAATFASNSIQATDGSVTTPSFTFINQTTTGMYRNGSNSLSLAVSSGDRIVIDPSGTTGTAGIRHSERTYFPDGTAALPSIAFGSDTNTGIYRIGSDDIGISLNGTKYVDISASVTAFANSISATGTGFNPVAYQMGATNTGFTASLGGFITGVFGGAEVLRISNGAMIAWKGMQVGDGINNMFYTWTNKHYSQTAMTLSVANNSDYLYIQVGPNVQIYMDSEFDYMQYTVGSGSNSTHNFVVGGSEILRINSTSIRPTQDNVTSNGVSGKRWTAVWAANGTIQTSHSSTKTNIVDLDADTFEVPRGVLYDRDGRRYLGYLNDTIPDEGRPFTEEGTISHHDNYEQAVIGILCSTVRQLKEDNKIMKQQLKDLLDSKE